MRPIDKKRVKAIAKKISELSSLLEELCDEHQEWMDEHDDIDNWDCTPTGESADEDQYNFECWRDSIEDMESEMQDIIG